MKVIKVSYGDRAEQLKARIQVYKQLEDKTGDRRLLSHYRYCIRKALDEFTRVIGLAGRSV